MTLAASHQIEAAHVESRGGGQNSAAGLSSSEAERRLSAYGPNLLESTRDISLFTLLTRQFQSPVIGLLFIAAVVSAALGEWLDAIAIGVIVIVNALIGFVQEYRADQAVLALRSLTSPRARVVRDGRSLMVEASTVVPGDLIILEPGDVVPADARLYSADGLTTNEAPLTGESVPAEKLVTPSADDAPLAERHDFVFMGSSVATGTAKAIVVSTGMRTELGRIARLLSQTEKGATPLQRRVAYVTRTLTYACVAIVALVAAVGILRGWPPIQVFMAGISLAVAAVPEGLPAVVTIALAVGVQRMAARRVLVRKLPAVETLGCVTVICTDKTGTLTTGQMQVREVWGADEAAVLYAAAACSNAEINQGGAGIGDPTEVAILWAAGHLGIDRLEIESAAPRIREIPFDSVRKWMSIERADGQTYLKGAPETVFGICADNTDDAFEAHTQMARRGLRVLAVAMSDGARPGQMVLLGLVGIADPPRAEAIQAVTAARRAGIDTVMITGDHPVTAREIARELGIGTGGTPSQDEFVHARATPEDKLRIVRNWKSRGAVVAMTGDGVNDAPALREAHVGIAMGLTGTEVTREASDMILADDNFASIVAAVREGRGIFDNIRKTLVYLLSGNTAELIIMLVAAVSGLPWPLLPLQLLWINVVTDGLPALALVIDPAETDVLERPPRRPDEPMLGRPEWQIIGATGLLQAAATLSVFIWALEARDLSTARNLAFSVLVFGELFRAFAARSATRVFWEVGAFTNLRLLAVVILSVLLQLGIHHLPLGQQLFGISPLSASDCLLTVGVALVPVTLIEVGKLVRRRHFGRPVETAG